MGIWALSTILQGCWPDLNSGINSLAIFYCDAQPAGLSINHDAQLIKIKIPAHQMLECHVLDSS
jgi:hypothetical protein